MYTITFNKQFRDLGLSTYLNYSHQTYWDRAPNDRYNLMVSRYFDIGDFKNVSVSLSAYRNRYNERNDDGCTCRCRCPGAAPGRSVTT